MVLTPQAFARIRAAQADDDEIAPLEVPKQGQTFPEFTPDFCELVADVVGELAGEWDLSQVSYEQCLEDLVIYFERVPRPVPEDVFEDLQIVARERDLRFRYGFCHEVADLILTRSLEFTLRLQ
jgi:hypothetical protein